MIYLHLRTSSSTFCHQFLVCCLWSARHVTASPAGAVAFPAHHRITDTQPSAWFIIALNNYLLEKKLWTLAYCSFENSWSSGSCLYVLIQGFLNELMHRPTLPSPPPNGIYLGKYYIMSKKRQFDGGWHLPQSRWWLCWSFILCAFPNPHSSFFSPDLTTSSGLHQPLVSGWTGPVWAMQEIKGQEERGQSISSLLPRLRHCSSVRAAPLHDNHSSPGDPFPFFQLTQAPAPCFLPPPIFLRVVMTYPAAILGLLSFAYSFP